MNFLVDENISHRTLKFLKELSYDVKGVPEHLKGSDDENIVSLAIEEDQFVITLDLDFGRIYYFSRREEVGMIVLRVRLPTVERVNQVLGKFLRTVWRCWVFNPLRINTPEAGLPVYPSSFDTR